METKPLLYGLIGFFIGGFLVSVAATTFDKPVDKKSATNTSSMSTMSMDDMSNELKNKTGEDYDKSFISNMIVHHEGAVEMAKLSNVNAKHDEIKELSNAIMTAQEKEIAEMKQWQKDWGYVQSGESSHTSH